MKKTTLLHGVLSHTIARMGHGDMLVIGDAGLPIPPGVCCIDLAVTRGVPTFAAVLEAVLGELQVERAVVAMELGRQPASGAMRATIGALLPDITVDELPHAQLKELTRRAAAIVRTGEFTPYANIVLVAGVVF